MGDSPLFYKEPINLESGEGVWLYDKSGKKYLDVYNNVPVAGHCHPRIIASLTDQASKLNVHSRYVSDVVVDYSEKLISLHSDNLSKLQMACSGTEAVEIAIKMARIHTGGEGIICSNATYHGNSHETFRMTIGPFEPEFRRVTYPEFYRPIEEGLSEQDLCELYVKEVEKQIKGFKQDGIKFAGLIFCSIFANEGLPDFPKDYLTKVSKLVRDSGGVVILDEVQAGFGRTGTWWGYELSNVSPDIVVMGKPMGSGLPVSGVVATEEITNSFHKKAFYFNTTAATPLQAAVGRTVIDIIQDEGLIENAAKVGNYLKNELKNIKDNFDFLGDVRGPGLFIGLDIVDNKEDKNPDKDKAIELVEKLKTRGVLISNAGQYRNVLKLRPPLIFDSSHADLLLERLGTSFKEVS
ncbi:MAG: aspartate aminotransferase family protein [SAR86 cluster bacterium]|nr:aspartate aminotransferase family protein [SAR86 cluster bacterium]